MVKTVKIEFNEQSKGVTATTKIEVTDDEKIDTEKLKKESKELFEWAFKQSQAWSLRK